MEEHLIVQNDEDADFVQFTVEIPDGFKSFKLASINGTMINQNFLNIGDIIKFKFSNNPIVYSDCPKLMVVDTTTDTTMGYNPVLDSTQYKNLSLDVFNIYRVKYVPIYSYYSSNIADNAYIFNPGDKNELLDEPETKKVPDYCIQKNPPLYCPFSGQYVITLVKVDKIEDINVVIGESIPNSKTQPTDLNINSAGEVIPENQTGTSYSYGNYWRYEVKNLLMNHRLSIINDFFAIPPNTYICFWIQSSDYYTSPWHGFNNSIIPNHYIVGIKPRFYFQQYDTDENEFINLEHDYAITLTESLTCRVLVKVPDTSPVKYKEIPYNGDTPASPAWLNDRGYIPKGCSIRGSTLLEDSGQNYIVCTINNGVVESHDITDFTTPNSQGFPINPVCYYTGNAIEIEVRPIENGRDLTDKTISFSGFSSYKLIKCDGLTRANVYINTAPSDIFEVVFLACGFTENNSPIATNIECLLGESITLNSAARYKFIHSLNTGYIKRELLVRNEKSYDEKLYEPVQLTQYMNGEAIPADDDLIITRQDNNLKITTGELSNNVYYCHFSGTKYDNIEIKPMTGSNNKTPLVFIPKKTNSIIKPFACDSINPVDGLMVVEGVNGGNNFGELMDSNSALFLANGHELLNVKPPREDDFKFKTFNGSITFDRSNTRITRLFSMSNSNSCIGYINDILSAKLSRYYFTANYSIFNTFIASSGSIPFSTSLNQALSIYSGDQSFDFYSGAHEVLLASCGDIVKLIGCDVITNNCFPGLTPEEHMINCEPLIDELDSLQTDIKDKIEIKPFYYKLFHYYNSGFNQYPSIGENGAFTNGIRLLNLTDTVAPEAVSQQTYKTQGLSSSAVFITNKERANNSLIYFENGDIKNKFEKYISDIPRIKFNEFSGFSETLTVGDTTTDYELGGFIHILPVPRIYRNNNFEQSDLTISTGRIKTLAPVYIQTAPRVILNNILYMVDLMVNTMIEKYGGIRNDSGMFDYIIGLKKGDAGLENNGHCILRRFGKKEVGAHGYLSLSFDSCLVLNYFGVSSINEYVDDEEMEQSLPTSNNETMNEEIIWDIKTTSAETNIQLFSSRYFNFHENISLLSFVCFVQVINQILELSANNKTLAPYFGSYSTTTSEDVNYEYMNGYVNNFYSNVLLNNNYNIPRTIKVLISKLGEFLDYPKIIFGTTLNFKSSRSVNIQYMTPTKYENSFTTKYLVNSETNNTKIIEEFNPKTENKNNVALFGVVFKYHQLSLGWQQMINDIPDRFIISNARGVKHFTLVLVDEYGRRIPNIDTSQGFKNNLKLEIENYSETG